MPLNNSRHNHEEINFDLADLFTFFWQQKFRLLITIVILVGAAGYYISNLTKIYSATSTILLGNGDSSFGLPSALSGLSGGGRGDMETHLEFIRSRKFIERVVDAQSLTFEQEFRSSNKELSAEEQRKFAVGVVLKNLVLSKVGDTDLLKITYYSESPRIAADIANYIGPEFFVYHAEMNKEKAGDTYVWLNSQLLGLQKKLVNAENALQIFIEENQLIGVKGQIELLNAEIGSLLTERLRIEKLQAEAKSTALLVELANGDSERLMQIPLIMNHSMVVQLENNILSKEQAFTELAKRYKEKHHKYIAMRSVIDALLKERETLLGRIVAGLKQSIYSIEQRLKDVKLQIEAAKTDYGALSVHELKLTRLNREIDSTQNLYDIFVSRLQQTAVTKDLDENSEFAIVDYASIPLGPTKPKKVMLFSVAVMMSTLLSCGFWLILHLISDKQTRYRQLLRNLNVPLLAEIPKIKSASNSKSINKTLGEGQQDYIFSEAIRSLRTSILMRSDESGGKKIVLTGIQDHDGKTTISVSLALAFAKLERVILVDSDLRIPTLARVFGLAKKQPGLSSFISGRVKFSDCLFRQPDTRLNVLPSGPTPSDPMIHISRPRFAQLIKRLGEVYDRVILDAPSVNTVSDVLVIAKHVDSVILVCDIEKLESDSLIEAVQRLRENNTPLLGVVFNKVKRVSHRRRKDMTKQTLVISQS